jgi:hypothetical protein
MATAPQHKTPSSDHDDSSAQATELRAAPGNDTAEARVFAALVRSRDRTWHIFARSLLLGALLAGLGTSAVILYIY